jgi:membrane protease YdiL (CAAX protease family)
MASWGAEPALALFLGIGLVIAPLELGYLLLRAKAVSGSWSLSSVIAYRERPRAGQYLIGLAAYAWFIAMLVLSLAVLDQWLADRFFAWTPESIRGFAGLGAGEDEEELSAGVVVVLAVLLLALNGLVGPVVEELYFRGHLLPALARYGRWAPVVNALLFSVYHFWTPWQNPARFIGLLPWVYVVWKTRSLYLSIAIHVAVNVTFVLLLTAALAAS